MLLARAVQALFRHASEEVAALPEPLQSMLNRWAGLAVFVSRVGIPLDRHVPRHMFNQVDISIKFLAELALGL